MAEINIKGEVISPGTVEGTLCFVNFKADPLAYKDNLSHRDVSREISRFGKEVDSVIDELIEVVRVLQKDSLFEEAEIIQTHIVEGSGSFLRFATPHPEEQSDEGSHEILQPFGFQDEPSAKNREKNSQRAQLNKYMSICGEIASDINFLQLLVGLGFDNLSIDFHVISAVKRHLLSLNAPECRKLAQECLKAGRADRVKAILNEFNRSSQKARVVHSMDNPEFIDPVCKMIVHAEGNKLMVIRGNKRYYFCCRKCRDKFVKYAE